LSDKYQYAGFTERTYPDIIIPGEGSLVVEPGDIREFEAPPSDGLWFPVKPKSKKADA
jgi:hypothetical protein